MSTQPQVPEVDGIDLDFTPRSYFTARDLHVALPSDIMGQAPLSMRQLVAMLDGACGRGGAVLSPVVANIEYGGSVDDHRGFVTVESDFYPDLGGYYQARLDRWFGENAPEDEEEE